MALLDLSPEVRAQFLEMCGYRAGRTSNIESYMEVSYQNQKYSDVRPDGLISATRGTNNWAAFVEAKARNSKIRSEQIIEYLELAAQLDVGNIITISNEFARSPDEQPYHIAGNKLRRRNLFHFAWADIRTFLERVKVQTKLEPLEMALLEQCLEFFWDEDSGISTFDKMPQDWSKFVDSARTGVGFSSKTPGITEIVHAWQQERRDLCSKLSHWLQQPVVSKHFAGSRASSDERLKADRARLADEYELEAHYQFKESKCELLIVADLVNRRTTLRFSLQAPDNKKAKASVTWFLDTSQSLSISPSDVIFEWKGRGKATSHELTNLRSNPASAWEGQKDKPKSIQLLSYTENAASFKSAKKFISTLEMKAHDIVKSAEVAGWI